MFVILPLPGLLLNTTAGCLSLTAKGLFLFFKLMYSALVYRQQCYGMASYWYLMHLEI